MSDSLSLRDAIEGLASDKIKTRTLALSELRRHFARDKVVQEQAPKSWNAVFVALFDMCKTERNVTVKKTKDVPAAALRRLNDATAAIRWLIERTAPILQRKTVKVLLSNIFKEVLVNSRVHDATALDYIKSLRLLLAHAAHLNHLEEVAWLDAVELCYGAAMSKKISFFGDDWTGEKGLQLEEEYLGDVEAELTGSKDGKPIKASTAARLDTKRSGQELTEIFTVLAYLFQSHNASAIILLNAKEILQRTIILFRLLSPSDQSPETTAHLPFLQALNALLVQMDLNTVKYMSEVGTLLWRLLMRLFAVTRSLPIKEQIVIALTRLVPPVFREQEVAKFAPESCARECWESILGETEARSRIEPLVMEHLRLQNQSTAAGQKSIFSEQAFQAASTGFSASDVLSWTTMKLAADCLHLMHLGSDKVIGNLDGPGPSKRRKIPNPVEEFLDSLENGTAPSNSSSSEAAFIYRLQILLFFISRHWDTLHTALQSRIFQTLLTLLSNSEPAIQSWVLLCIAVLIPHTASSSLQASTGSKQRQTQASPTKISKSKADAPTDWEHIWLTSLRKLNVPPVARSAAYCLDLLLSTSLSSSSRVNRSRLVADLDPILRDLTTQGPHYPCDTVCWFFVSCLELARDDVVMSRLDLPEKMFGWLCSGIWRPASKKEAVTKGQAVDTCAMLALLLQLTVGQHAPFGLIDLNPSVWPTCESTRAAICLHETEPIRKFIYSAELPQPQMAAHEPKPTAAFPTLLEGTTSASIANRLSSFLAKAVEDQDTNLQNLAEHKSGFQLPLERVRRLLQLCTIVILFEGSLACTRAKFGRLLFLSAANLLQKSVPLAAAGKWKPFEKAELLSDLQPIFAPFMATRDVDEIYPGLVPPGYATMIPQAVVHRFTLTVKGRKALQPALQEVLRKAWSSSDLAELLDNGVLSIFLLSALSNAEITSDDTGIMATQAASSFKATQMDLDESDSDDSFGGKVREGGVVSTAGRSGGASILGGNVTSNKDPILRPKSGESTICIRVAFCGLTTLSWLRNGMPVSHQASQMTQIVTSDFSHVFTDCKEENFFNIARGFLDITAAGGPTITLEEAEAILTRCAEDLSLYKYAREEEPVECVTKLLTHTQHLWIGQHPETTSYRDKAKTMCTWLTETQLKKKIHSWRMRLDLVSLLDSVIRKESIENAWGDAEHPLDAFGDPVSPRRLISAMVDDTDIRIRFRIACSTALALDYIYQVSNNEEVDSFFNAMVAQLRTDIDHYEHILTRLLCLSNTMISCSRVRFQSYNHMVIVCQQSIAYEKHSLALLEGVATRLGLPSVQSLFNTYAPQFVFNRSNVNPLALPESICGFPSTRARAASVFMSIGGFLANEDDQHDYLQLSEVTGIDSRSALSQCFPYYLANVLAEAADVGRLSAEKVQEAFVKAQKKYRQTDIHSKVSFDDALERTIDLVATRLLSMLYEIDCSANGPIKQVLLTSDAQRDPEGNAAKIFGQMFRNANATRIEAHGSVLYSSAIVYVLHWLSLRVPSILSTVVLQSIFSQMLVHIDQSPFVDDQLRLLASLVVMIALARNELSQPVLFKRLFQGFAALYEKPDLVHAVWGCIHYMFMLYEHYGMHDSGAIQTFPSIVLSIIRAAQCHRRSFDSMLADAAKEHLSSLRNVVQKLVENTVSGSAARQHGIEIACQISELNDLASDCTVASLVAIAQKQCAEWDSRFDLVNFLASPHNKAITGAGKPLGVLLWNLLSSLPAHPDVSEQSSQAFLTLLCYNRGLIALPTLDSTEAASIHAPLQREDGIEADLIRSTAALLSRKEIAIAGLALKCLRNIFAASNWSSFEHMMDLTSDDILETSLIASDSLRRPFAIEKPLVGQSGNLQDLHKSTSTSDQADYSTWLTSFTQALLAARARKGGGFYSHLQPLCQKSPGFARSILPTVVYSLLLASISESRAPTVAQTLTEYFTSLLRSKKVSDQILAAVVDTIMHLRKFHRPSSTTEQPSTTPLSGDAWLGVPWSLVAKAAINVNMPSTAVLCLELTREHGTEPERILLKSAPTEIATSIRDTQSAIYAAIDEPDGFYGIQFSDAKDGLAQKYRHERNVTAAFELVGSRHEASFAGSASLAGGKSALVEALSSFGFSHLALATLQGSSTSNEDFPRDDFLDLAWRTEAWDLPSTLFATNGTPAQSVYSSLRDIHRSKDRQLVLQRLSACITQQTIRLGSIGPERPQPDSKAVQALLALNEMQLWLQNDPARLGSIGELVSDRLVTLAPEFRYADAEMVMSVRIAMLRGLRRAEERTQFADHQSDLYRHASFLESSCHVRLSEKARLAGSLQMSLNSISAAENLMKELDDVPDAVLQVQIQQELAQVLWKKEEHVLAIRNLARQAESMPDGDERKASMLAQLGTWSSEARLLDPVQIRERYFEPATAVFSAARDLTSRTQSEGEVCYLYAMFADRQFLALEAQQPDFLRLESRFARRQSDLNELSRRLKNSQDPAHQQLKTSGYESERVLEQERVKLEEYRTSKDAFLRLAIRQLSYVLQTCDRHDDTVHRLCALWFAHAADDKLNKAVAEDLQRIPSGKFTFLSHQLAARLSRQSTTASAFQSNLKAVVHRLCLDHPFHILYQLYPLRQGASSILSTTKARRTSQEPSAQLTRGLAAEDMHSQLRKVPKMQQILQDLDLACESYVEWASYDIKTHDAYKKWAKNKKLPTPTLPDGLKLRALRNMRLPVSTCHLQLDPTCQYDQPSIPMIQKYAKEFRTAGGVNLPKISDCIGSDGVRYKQLFKGGDDTRQDAVMEQVFSLVNDLLSSDDRTSKRSLRIRTYKVLPLTGSTGLMEHAGAVQLSDLTSELLKSVQPSGWSYQKCRSTMQGAEDKDVAARVEVLETILQHNRPVLRHIFYQKQHQAYKWFQMRLNYTRSVATNSIVGFILGIGDRHTSNLLFDTVQGEIVPIDFGVAFDSGTRLPIPELVPFRLTQNFVDAFGMSGVEGVYRRCCEETLRVLREKSSVIMTILEVFKYDPLQKWTVSADKVKKVQNSQMGTPTASNTRASASRVASQMDVSLDDDDVPTDAAQALAVVAEKLSSSLSVEYKVNELIQQAMDVRRLAVIFRGWQPVGSVLRVMIPR